MGETSEVCYGSEPAQHKTSELFSIFFRAGS